MEYYGLLSEKDRLPSAISSASMRFDILIRSYEDITDDKTILTITFRSILIFNASNNLRLYGITNRAVIYANESSSSLLLSSPSARDIPFSIGCYATPECD